MLKDLFDAMISPENKRSHANYEFTCSVAVSGH